MEIKRCIKKTFSVIGKLERDVKAYNSEQKQKQEILKFMLKGFNAGRRKSYY